MMGRQMEITETPGVTMRHAVIRWGASGDGSQNLLCNGDVK